MKEEIQYEDFSKLDIRIGTILKVEAIEGADKLLKLTLDVGLEAPRTVAAGIKEFVGDAETLVGLQVPVLVNLAPRSLRGVESQGMILAAGRHPHGVAALLHPDRQVEPGTEIR